jgi:hypothetical protein
MNSHKKQQESKQLKVVTMDISHLDIYDIKSLFLCYEIFKQLQGEQLDFFLVSEIQYDKLNKDDKLLKEEYFRAVDYNGFVTLRTPINTYLESYSLPKLAIKGAEDTKELIELSDIEIIEY